MFQSYYPWSYVESVFSIDYRKLYEGGVRGIIFDIDNTLVAHGKDSTPEVDALFQDIAAVGLKTALLTDNNEERVLRFIRNIDTPYVCLAGKPDKAPFLRAASLMGLEKDQVVVVGDSVFTDIRGANNSGMRSILVKYIGYYTETKIGKKRRIEKVILSFYRRNKACRDRLGDISKEA